MRVRKSASSNCSLGCIHKINVSSFQVLNRGKSKFVMQYDVNSYFVRDQFDFTMRYVP